MPRPKTPNVTGGGTSSKQAPKTAGKGSRKHVSAPLPAHTEQLIHPSKTAVVNRKRNASVLDDESNEAHFRVPQFRRVLTNTMLVKQPKDAGVEVRIGPNKIDFEMHTTLQLMEQVLDIVPRTAMALSDSVTIQARHLHVPLHTWMNAHAGPMRELFYAITSSAKASQDTEAEESIARGDPKTPVPETDKLKSVGSLAQSKAYQRLLTTKVNGGAEAKAKHAEEVARFKKQHEKKEKMAEIVNAIRINGLYPSSVDAVAGINESRFERATRKLLTPDQWQKLQAEEEEKRQLRRKERAEKENNLTEEERQAKKRRRISSKPVEAVEDDTQDDAALVATSDVDDEEVLAREAIEQEKKEKAAKATKAKAKARKSRRG